MTLDLRTITYLISFSSVVVSIGLFLTARRYPPSVRGINTYVLSNVFQFFGFLLLGMRGIIPDFFSVVVGNLFVFLTTLYQFIALKQFFSRPYSRWPLILSSTGIFFSFNYFLYIQPDINIRVALISFPMSAFMFINVVTIWRNRRVTPGIAPVFLIVSFLIPGIILGLRSFSTFGPAYSIESVFAENLLQNLSFMSVFFNILLSTFGFLLLLNERLTAELSYRATHDSLTGVLGHAAILDEINSHYQKHANGNPPLSILMIDIDNFKQVNDQYGHLVGDKTLQEIARYLERSFEGIGKLGRYGGDEFIAVLPGYTEEDSKQKADEICEEFESAADQLPVEDGLIHISIGIAQLAPEDASAEAFIQRADQAMYAEKRRPK